MSDPVDDEVDDLDGGEAYNGVVDGWLYVEGTPDDVGHPPGSAQCWMVDEAVLELLAASEAWKAWDTNPRRPPSGTGHPGDIYGPHGMHYREPHSSRNDLRDACLENHGGGVPIEVIEALVHAAGVVGARARAVAHVAASIALLQRGLGRPVSRKPLREAIWFWWNVPRFDQLPKIRSKYPLTLKWSPAAWDAHADPKVGLVIEHVTPLGIHIQQLIDADGDEFKIRAILHDIEFVVITKAEDAKITSAGWRQKAPDGENRNQRYIASGLQPETFFVPADLPNGSAL